MNQTLHWRVKWALPNRTTLAVETREEDRCQAHRELGSSLWDKQDHMQRF